jgi:hypothetical protein
MSRKTLFVIPLSLFFVLILAVVLITGTFANPDYSIEVADRTGFAEVALPDGAIVQYIGDQNTTFGSAGSGVFDSFVRLQGNNKKTEVQKGYNTDGAREWDTKAGAFTHSILLSEIPTIEVGGVLYWEFFADINDSDSTPRISLDDLELYLTLIPNLTGYPFVSSAAKIYDYDSANEGHFILINDVNQGSGRGDLRYLVPQNGFDPGICSYGNPACMTYLVLYSVWGGKGAPYGFDGGFEEWKVKKYPILQVSKDINGAYDTPVSWTITKDYDATYDLFTGESVIHDYQVAVNPVLGDPENTKVSGTITIVGDDDEPVEAAITDLFNGIPATITGCSVDPVDGKYPIAAGATVTCSYELDLVGPPIDGTNVARATFTVNGANLAFQGSAGILATEYVETLTGDPDIDVTDTNGESWSTSNATAATWTYNRTFTCDGDEGTHVNTTTISQTGDSDIATVTLNCYGLTVTKDADEFYTRYFEWDITKTVTPASWGLFSGESGTSEYTVTLDQTGFYENDWQVSGEIEIANSHPTRDAELTQVIDDAGGITGNVNCPSATVPAGGSLTCSYATNVQDSLNANPFGDTNTATATQNLYNFPDDGTPDSTKDYSGTHPINFSEATVNLVDEQATVSDTYAGSTVSGTYTGDMTFTYTRTFTCDGDAGQHDNTASFTTNDTPLSGSDDASVIVNCYNLSVTKTADEFYTRYYEWMIDKVVDNPGPIQLSRGESVTVNYTIMVNVTVITENDWQVSGNILIENQHPSRSADLIHVLDDAGGIAGVVSCPSLVVPAGGSLTCTYATAVQNSVDNNPFGGTNTATARQQLYTFDKDLVATINGFKDYTGIASINFSDATINHVDESIDVSDSYAGYLGTVNATTDTLPAYFYYSRTISAGDTNCGQFQVDNTATFVTNDTGATGSDNASVVIEVACEGCTPGFWQGGAGSPLWNEADDPQWIYGGSNPFTHITLFNDFFYVVTDSRLDGYTMYQLVSSGGGSDPAVKAARDMVAAYLNESAFPGTFPAESLGALTTMWYSAVLGGDAGFRNFHAIVSGWNDPPQGGYCPLP